MWRLLLGTMGVKSLVQGLNAAATAGFEPRTVWSEVRRRNRLATAPPLTCTNLQISLLLFAEIFRYYSDLRLGSGFSSGQLSPQALGNKVTIFEWFYLVTASLLCNTVPCGFVNKIAFFCLYFSHFFPVFFSQCLPPILTLSLSLSSQSALPTPSHPYLSKVLCRLFCVFAWRSASAVKLKVAKHTKCVLWFLWKSLRIRTSWALFPNEDYCLVFFHWCSFCLPPMCSWRMHFPAYQIHAWISK